jgi:hypothetical protein
MQRVIENLEVVKKILTTHKLSTLDTMNDLQRLRKYTRDLRELVDSLILQDKLYIKEEGVKK